MTDRSIEIVKFTSFSIERHLTSGFIFFQKRLDASYRVSDSKKYLVLESEPTNSESYIIIPNNDTVFDDFGTPFFPRGFFKNILALSKIIQEMVLMFIPESTSRIELFRLTYPPAIEQENINIDDAVYTDTDYEYFEMIKVGYQHGHEDGKHDLSEFGNRSEEVFSYIENSDAMQNTLFESSLCDEQKRGIDSARGYYHGYMEGYDVCRLPSRVGDFDYLDYEDYCMNYKEEEESDQ